MVLRYHASNMNPLYPPISPSWLSELPQKDPWSTPFAESLLSRLHVAPGMTILDVACGGGVPAFRLAHLVGPSGRVVGIDCHEPQLARSRAIQGPHFPWLEFCQADVRSLPSSLEAFDRITGNLSFMFFRPDRKAALQQLTTHLKPGGQIVLTFPSQGTFDSLWQQIDQKMLEEDLGRERQAFQAYLHERPSAEEAQAWLEACGLERVDVVEFPLEVETGPGPDFLYHPLLRGGFLEDVYECFLDQSKADAFMNNIAQDVERFLPLMAQRCVMSGWRSGPQ